MQLTYEVYCSSAQGSSARRSQRHTLFVIMDHGLAVQYNTVQHSRGYSRFGVCHRVARRGSGLFAETNPHEGIYLELLRIVV